MFLQMTTKKVVVHLWGDSHLTKRHPVPRLLKERLEAGQFGRYQVDPVIHAVSGQKLDKAYVEQMRGYIKKHDGRPMCHVLQIGSNDLWDRPTEATVEGVLAFVRDVANKVLESRTSALVLTAPIPGDKPDAAPFFEKLDEGLRMEVEKVKKNRRLTYVDFVSRSFKRAPDGSRYDPAFWEDHRHLNRRGAAKFVAHLTDVIRTLPMVVFGLKKTKTAKYREKRREMAVARDGYERRGKGRQGPTSATGSSKPKIGKSDPRMCPQVPPSRWDLRHQLGPRDLRSQLSRPARSVPTYRYDAEGLPQPLGRRHVSSPPGMRRPAYPAPSATVTSGALDLMSQPLPAPTYWYNAEGRPQPMLPPPMAPMWQPLPPMWHVPPPPPPMPAATKTTDRSWMLPAPLQPTVVSDEQFEEERRRTERLQKLKEKRDAEYRRMKEANDALERELLGDVAKD